MNAFSLSVNQDAVSGTMEALSVLKVAASSNQINLQSGKRNHTPTPVIIVAIASTRNSLPNISDLSERLQELLVISPLPSR